jgi:DNA replication protein DnaC
MFINQTIDKLHEMRLTGMAEALTEQLNNPDHSELSFEERIAWLVDRHWSWRENRSLKRRLANAKLRDREASVEAIDFRRPRGLDRSVIRSLAACQWVERHHNLIITGPCGVGKSFLACALAQKAIRERYTGLYTRQPPLLRDLAIARADGSLDKRLGQLARVDVLIIDDWMMTALGESERRDILEIVEDRYNTRSTILTSQIPIDQWHEQIGDPTSADSILDRLVHNAYRIELKGESMRKVKAAIDKDNE